MATRQAIPVETALALTTGIKLQQDPHAVRGGEKRLEVAIGLEVRLLRKHVGLTVAELAEKSGVSLGMLSKIENGLTSPSLTTLQSIAHSLGVQISQLLKRFEEQRPAHFVGAGEGAAQERRGTRAGHQYQLLGFLGSNDSGVIVEPYMITLNDDSDVFPTFQHDGLEFLYMLEGSVEYRHADEVFIMQAGDSLFFHADAPHGPERLITLPARYLSIISYPQGGTG
ncbi:MAG: helix-turn-helix domain-containing protein [Granulosicoccus sp.]